MSFGKPRAQRAMVLSLFAFLAVFLISNLAVAQSDSTLANGDPAVAGAPKAHAKKPAHKSANAASSPAQPNSEAAEKAARLAAGRKKFFERSMGFDNGTSYDSPVTLGNGADGGLSPQMGVKF